MPTLPQGGISGQAAVDEVERFIGDRYVYGAAGPSTFDCSGLMQYVFRQLGISIPRTSEEQRAATTPISRSQLEPGDLVFSEGTTHPGHVGMYVGERGGTPTVVEAPHTGAVVRYTPLSQFDPSGYGRIKGLSSSATTADDASLSSDLGGLLSFPSQIVGFFSKATDDLADVGKFAYAFTQPSTWVRIGAGGFGFLFLIAGLVFLIRSGVEK